MRNLPLILFVFAFVLGCSQSKQTTENLVPVPVRATELAKAYQDNEVAADSRFGDKKLEVTGTIIEISNVMNTYQIDLEGVKEHGLDILQVKCNVEPAEKDFIAKLRKGQTVTLIGMNEGKTLSLYVGLNNCRIKS